MLPSLRGLQALKRLHTTGSLAAAARELGVSPSALSHRIGDLQAQLGIGLVVRRGRGLALTDDAEALLLSVGDAVDRIELAVRPLHRRHGELRISTVGTFASLWLLPRLGDFLARHPGIAVSVSTTRRAVDLESEDVDCAIRHGLGPWPPFQATRLFGETLVPVAAAAGDLAELPPVRARTRLRDWDDWHGRAGVLLAKAAPGIVVDHRAQALDVVLGGGGATMIDAAFIGEHVATGRLRALGPTMVLDDAYYFVRGRPLGNLRLVRDFEAWLGAQVDPDLPNA